MGGGLEMGDEDGLEDEDVLDEELEFEEDERRHSRSRSE